ncbi:nuclear transport factor 2 family protein [Cellulomonas sp. URHB0016]
MTVTQSTEATTRTTDETVDAFFTAFGGGDHDTLLGLFADPVDLRVAGASNVPWAGSRSTAAEVAEFFGILGDQLEPQAFDLTGRVTQGGDAVAFASCDFVALATGKAFHNDFALHFSVADGRITRFHMYEDSYAIHAAFVAG